jgi:hypothetical protein
MWNEPVTLGNLASIAIGIFVGRLVAWRLFR